MRKFCLPLFTTFLLLSCKEQPVYVEGKWITGDEHEKVEKIERQFRGFDLAMVEVGYRYQELYWAGLSGNWDYADYQADKIEIALRNGLERRPARAKSAEHFLHTALPEMKNALTRRDSVRFQKNFQKLTVQCNVCHAMEKVPHFNVQIPVNKPSPIGPL